MQEEWVQSWPSRGAASGRWRWTLAGLLLVGSVAFVAGLLAHPLRTWQIYLVNYLFWGGLAQGAVVFAAVYHVVGAKWGYALRRLGEGMAAYVGVSLLLFFPLYPALKVFFGPLHAPRGAWFDPRFIFVRGALGIGLMTVLSVFFFYYAARPEVGLLLERGRVRQRWPYSWLTGNWQGYVPEAQRCQRGMDFLSVGVLLAYPVTYSFMAFDLIMSLDPYWYSSLFGGYFFISTFYLGLAGLAVAAVLLRDRLGSFRVPPETLWDIGKLLMGFDLTYLAMVWAQYVVIWYGNLPEETHFVVLRIWQWPWALLSWGVMAASVFIPFVVFLSQRAKQEPRIMLSVGLLIAAGLWVERYVLVVPSLWRGHGVPLGWIELGVTAGFLGAFGLSYLYFAERFPLAPLVEDRLSAAANFHGKTMVEKRSP